MTILPVGRPSPARRRLQLWPRRLDLVDDAELTAAGVAQCAPLFGRVLRAVARELSDNGHPPRKPPRMLQALAVGGTVEVWR